MAAQFRGCALPDATTVPLADGGADDRAEEVCQAGRTAGIYGIVFTRRALVQNREIFRLLPYSGRRAVFYGKNGSCRVFSVIYAAVTHVLFLEKLYQEKAVKAVLMRSVPLAL